MRRSFATALLDAGSDIRTNQERLRHTDVATTMISTHVLDREGRGVRWTRSSEPEAAPGHCSWVASANPRPGPRRTMRVLNRDARRITCPCHSKTESLPSTPSVDRHVGCTAGRCGCRTLILVLCFPRGGSSIVRVPGFRRQWAWWRTVGWSGCEETGRPAVRRSSAACMHLACLPVPQPRSCYPTTGVLQRSLPRDSGDGSHGVSRGRPRCRDHATERGRFGPRATWIDPFCGMPWHRRSVTGGAG